MNNFTAFWTLAPQSLTRYPVKELHEPIFQRCLFGVEPPRSHLRCLLCPTACLAQPCTFSSCRFSYSHIESSFPYQAHTRLPCTLFPATRRWEWRAEYSWWLFCFTKPCHGHRLTPKTRWQRPREKTSWNASTLLPERPLFNIHRGLRGSGLLLFPWASFPSSCPLNQGKYLQLKKASEQLFLN